MQSRIIERILEETGDPRLFSILRSELPASDLQSLLLAVFKTRAEASNISQVFERARGNPLFGPSSLDARVLNRFDHAAFETAAAFEAVELSPVCPLALNAIVSRIDQNNVLTALRNAEVIADPTVAMALECARRRKDLQQRAPDLVTRICASQRVVRMQPFDVPGFTPHFKLFGLVTAGRDTGSASFEVQHLAEHIRFYLDLFRALNRGGFSFTEPRVEISDLSIAEAQLAAAGIPRSDVRAAVRAHVPGSAGSFLEERGITFSAEVPPVFQRLVDALSDYPEAQFSFNPSRLEGLGYYAGLCLRISPRDPAGSHHAIVDGGLTDWTARLLQDKKERLVTSGIGSEFACRRYQV